MTAVQKKRPSRIVARRRRNLEAFVEDQFSVLRGPRWCDDSLYPPPDDDLQANRYVYASTDGSYDSITLVTSLEDAANSAASDVAGSEFPYAPGMLCDLDTGDLYDPKVSVSFHPTEGEPENVG